GMVESKPSVATMPVVNVNDAPTGSVTITGIAALGQTLTVTNTLDDIDGMGDVSYQWQADGKAIAGATGTTLLLAQEHVGKAISVVAKYTDGQGTEESKASTAVQFGPKLNVVVVGTAEQGET